MEKTIDIISFEKHTSYKNSGVEWLGEIPEHWKLMKIKRVFNEVKKRTNVDLNCGSISFGKVIYKDDEKVPESTKKSYQVLLNGDFLVNPLNLNYDLISLRIALSEIDVVVSSGYIVLSNTVEVDKNYYKWFLHRFDVAYMKLLGSGVRQTLNYNDIGNCDLIFPPIVEQTVIGNFLDKKTAQIDLTIAQKEKQIELLNERRQILIHKAVTRGLNAAVPMKDTGADWIGEVPMNWRVTKAKFYSKVFVPERTKPDLNEDKDGVPWLTTEYLRKNELFESDIEYYVNIVASKKAKSRIIEAGSVVATCVGNFGIASKLNFNAIINQQIQGFTELKINADYLVYLLGVSNDYFDNNATLTTIKYVNKDTFGSMPILLPNPDEQAEIVNHIHNLQEKFGKAIFCKQKEIEKLKEYKATLINSAVTGKLKVC
jgi:type I restriction enzyme, S subunit